MPCQVRNSLLIVFLLRPRRTCPVLPMPWVMAFLFLELELCSPVFIWELSSFNSGKPTDPPLQAPQGLHGAQLNCACLRALNTTSTKPTAACELWGLTSFHLGQVTQAIANTLIITSI
ncbi:hypothetical protein B0F90DRAFT_688375 [Multifurca ochricompacta]|uniref:Uncharacterized protein n=1 Tax=Multifurca ochricompacta TaxID=376703 RepID=A0AAD4M388_9AGAM|nr:hypothetical protein B0F90DRAFT_688375 [Multifurca ochricompacta]